MRGAKMKWVAKFLVLVSMFVLLDGIAFAGDDAQVGQTVSNPCAAAADPITKISQSPSQASAPQGSSSSNAAGSQAGK